MRTRLIGVLTAALLALPGYSQDALHARVIDVGAGLCVVVKVTDGDSTKYMIYDAGFGGSTTLSAIEEFIPAGAAVDLMVLSHADSDHFAAAPGIMAAYPVFQVLRTGLDRDTLPGDQNPQAIMDGRNAIAASVAAGVAADFDLTTAGFTPGDSFDLADADAVFISGFGVMPPEWGLTDASKIRNAVSVVIRLDYDGRSILICGDTVGRNDDDPAGADCIAGEAFMLAGTQRLDSDVLIAAHHGADNASCAAFIAEVSPAWVLFSAGSKHEHPRQSTAERFLALTATDGSPLLDAAHLLRTDLGDNEGGDEWSFGSAAVGDSRGDDDIDIIILEGGEMVVDYRRNIGTPTPEAAGAVVIASVLPDPVGSDLQFEEATITNTGGQPQVIDGWLLRDEAGDSWSISGSLAAGESMTVLRNGRSMSLNNNGDTIELVNDAGEVVDRFVYGTAAEGEVLTPASTPVGARIEIFSMVPDPVGSDAQLEAVTIRNTGGGDLALAGWEIRDADGRAWALTGTLAAGEMLTVLRAGQPMTLNNGGDTVELVSPTEGVVERLVYGAVTEGQVVLAEDLR